MSVCDEGAHLQGQNHHGPCWVIQSQAPPLSHLKNDRVKAIVRDDFNNPDGILLAIMELNAMQI